MSDLRIAFAGDRDISVFVLEYLLSQGASPVLLCVSGGEQATHAAELIARCAHLSPDLILKGAQFRHETGLQLLREANIDYLVCIHFPYIVPDSVLTIPHFGALNLHPAYLPFNRGWHTPSWALLEETPIGATLHFMDTGVDTGDIIHQRALEPTPADTANTLYQQVKRLELQVFQEAWPHVVAGTYRRVPQKLTTGTTHKKKDLSMPDVQRIDLKAQVEAGQLLKKLRALTTNCLDEAAYYEVDGRRYHVQVTIFDEG